MKWTIDFILHEDFKKHVKETIEKYGDALTPFDIARFNKNKIDPVKLVFDKAVFGMSWNDIVTAEIVRQKDKSNTNDIGYFHQRIFQYFDNCTVPENGEEGGWDVIVDLPEGYKIDEDNTVHKIYAEVKNKHNTMNSAASSDTFIKMMEQMHEDDDCACMLVEAIATHSQNVIWKKKVRNRNHPVSQRRIRRVSIDQFYAIVTGVEDAFYQICMVLPEVINEILQDANSNVTVGKDTVYEELLNLSKQYRENPDIEEDEKAIMLAMYMLGFNEYNGFIDIETESNKNS